MTLFKLYQAVIVPGAGGVSVRVSVRGVGIQFMNVGNYPFRFMESRTK